jgi:hypothetical protein
MELLDLAEAQGFVNERYASVTVHGKLLQFLSFIIKINGYYGQLNQVTYYIDIQLILILLNIQFIEKLPIQ